METGIVGGLLILAMAVGCYVLIWMADKKDAERREQPEYKEQVAKEEAEKREKELPFKIRVAKDMLVVKPVDVPVLWDVFKDINALLLDDIYGVEDGTFATWINGPGFGIGFLEDVLEKTLTIYKDFPHKVKQIKEAQAWLDKEYGWIETSVKIKGIEYRTEGEGN